MDFNLSLTLSDSNKRLQLVFFWHQTLPCLANNNLAREVFASDLAHETCRAIFVKDLTPLQDLLVIFVLQPFVCLS